MRILLFFCFVFSSFNNFIYSQDFMIQGWYWDYPKTCNGNNWAATLDSKVNHLSAAGFTYVWLPPLSRASFGNCSNGYDPKDLYDLGEYGGGATGFGTRAALDALISNFTSKNLKAVADVVYNHRDGGKPENNSAVKDYITTHMSSVKNAFPSDRYRCILPVGGSTGNGAGNYYFKIKSKTEDSKYNNKQYTVYMQTNAKGWQAKPDTFEFEPNGGGDCGQGNNTIILGRNWNANIDASGCKRDEFHLNLTASDFNSAGDTIFIYLTNSGGNYSDHYIYGIWSGNLNTDIASQLKYQTYTDFTSMPSGQGSMNFENFKPNSANKSTTWLEGDWDWLWFFYDYDQFQSDTKTKLIDWSNWLWSNVGIRGYRMDAVKHFTEEFVGDLLDDLHSKGRNPGIVVGEYFDTNPNKLKTWVTNVKAKMDPGTKSAINVRAFDFDLRQALKDVCDNNLDTREVFISGMVDNAGSSGFDVITFVNNHDYRDPGQPVQNNTALAYAYILTNNKVGLPCVFYPEYFGEVVPNYPNINLQAKIDQLIGVHQDYILGSTSVDYLNRYGTPYTSNYISGSAGKALIYQLSGGIAGKEVIVAINFSNTTLKVDHGVNMTNLAQGDKLDDILGYSNFPYAVVSNTNQIYIELPPNSYSVWVKSESVLPAEFTGFNVRLDDKTAHLTWSTVDEQNVEKFTILRSVDGENFSVIGTLSANNRPSYYDWFDKNLTAGFTYYYRIETIDLDQSVSISPVRQVTVGKELKVLVYPNPVVDGFLYVQLQNYEDSEIKLQIAGADGMIKKQMTLSEITGTFNEAIHVEGLPSGIYVLNVSSSRINRNIRFMIK